MRKLVKAAPVWTSLTFLLMTPSAAFSQIRLQPSQVTVTSTIPNGQTQFPLSQISDGISDDITPFNGFVGRQNATGTISFTFDRPYSLNRIQIWNDINVQTQGVESYSLRLYSQNAVLGTVGPFTTTAGQQAPSVTSWSSGFPNVDKVDLIIHSIRRTGINRVEIREVSFDVLPDDIGAPAAQSSDYRCYNLLDHEQKTYPKQFTVVDQFGKTQTIIGHAIEICNPAKIDGDSTPAEMRRKYPAHLVCYAIVDRQNGGGEQQRLRITNSLEQNIVTSGQAEKICVSSTKEHISPPRKQ